VYTPTWTSRSLIAHKEDFAEGSSNVETKSDEEAIVRNVAVISLTTQIFKTNFSQEHKIFVNLE